MGEGGVKVVEKEGKGGGEGGGEGGGKGGGKLGGGGGGGGGIREEVEVVVEAGGVEVVEVRWW